MAKNDKKETIRTLDKVAEALEGEKRKFVQSVELAINLKQIDLSNPKNRVDGEIVLPKGRGKKIKVAIFATGELAVNAKKVADRVLSAEDIDDLDDKKKVKKLANEYDFFLSEPQLMVKIGKNLGQVLGPRGKMPKPIAPQANLEQVMARMRNTVRARSRNKMTFHVPVGTENMSKEELTENVDAVIKKLEQTLEKGKENIDSIYIKTTMGKAVRVM
jgi:large subunit ribosomal protein L1